MFDKTRTRLIAAVMAALAQAMLVSSAAAQQTRPAENAFANPSFELGRQFWQLSLGGRTEAKFEVAKDQAADGHRCGRPARGRRRICPSQAGLVGHTRGRPAGAGVVGAICRPIRRRLFQRLRIGFDRGR